MNAWNVRISEKFADDIRSIHSYISSELMEPSAADRLVNKILEEVNSLSFLPLRYSLYPKEPWKSRGLRKLPVENYLVFYIPDEENGNVNVLRVLYAGRNIENCLNG